MFVTNNSFSLLADQEQALAAIGIPAVGDVVTSAQAAAFLVEAGETVLVCGGPGVYEAVSARGAKPVPDGEADAVIVGFHRDFDYERMRVASEAVRERVASAGHQRRRHLSDAGWPDPWWRRDPRVRRHSVRYRGRRLPGSPTRRWPPWFVNAADPSSATARR